MMELLIIIAGLTLSAFVAGFYCGRVMGMRTVLPEIESMLALLEGTADRKERRDA